MNQRNEIWIVDDDHAIRWVLEKALAQEAIETRSFESADDVLEAIKSENPTAIVTDIRMPGMDGLTLLSHLNESNPDLPVIIMTAHADLDRAVAAFQGGAFEYLPKPFDVDDAVNLVKRAAKTRQSHASAVVASPSQPAPVSEIIGSAPAMQEVFRAIGRLSNSNMTVLLTGESGSGKELVAHALHKHSPRADKPFVAINTAAIPSELLESELFGHEKGAFTGATGQRIGRFEQADSGTLFLDEIGDMPAALQTRLLRVLADGEFYRVGGHQSLKVDVRVIAATHQNLEKRVKDGDFREDLFHRLNVIQLKLPALRERIEDVPALAEHFLETTAQELGTEPKRLRPNALEVFSHYSWPGNVRELENVCRRATIMAPSNEIDIEDLPSELLSGRSAGEQTTSDQPDDWESALKGWAERQAIIGKEAMLDNAMPKFEKIMIKVALTQTRGRRQEAAKLLGWGRNTLTRKIKELELDL
ncbi:MAG: nitrogen regulation protein NR(I) [Gammaproteobacteria bacterium]